MCFISSCYFSLTKRSHTSQIGQAYLEIFGFLINNFFINRPFFKVPQDMREPLQGLVVDRFAVLCIFIDYFQKIEQFAMAQYKFL